MNRIFVGIGIEGATAASLQSLTYDLTGATWTTKTNLHLTLRFVGEVSDPTTEHLSVALSRIRLPRFKAVLKGVGSFDLGNGYEALYAAAEGEDTLRTLRTSCEDAATEIGLAPDRRDWRPHVTVALIERPNQNDITSWLDKMRTFSTQPFQVSKFCLYSSSRSGRSVRYTKLRTYALDARENDFTTNLKKVFSGDRH
jgi:2'-5' RNA ligase